MRLIPKDAELGWTPYAWTVYVLFFTISPALARNATPIDRVTSIGGTIAVLVLYFRGYWLRGAAILPVIGVLTRIGAVILPMNSASGVAFIYAASFAARID